MGEEHAFPPPLPLQALCPLRSHAGSIPAMAQGAQGFFRAACITSQQKPWDSLSVKSDRRIPQTKPLDKVPLNGCCQPAARYKMLSSKNGKKKQHLASRKANRLKEDWHRQHAAAAPSPCKEWPFAVRLMVFRGARHGLSCCRRRLFATQDTACRKAKCHQGHPGSGLRPPKALKKEKRHHSSCHAKINNRGRKSKSMTIYADNTPRYCPQAGPSAPTPATLTASRVSFPLL